MLDKYFPIYIIVFSLTLTLTVVFEKQMIPRLARKAQQPIYNEGPSWHVKKSGTPTMGGLAFMLATVLSILSASLLFIFKSNFYLFNSLLLSVLYAFTNSAIGVIDDLQKLKRKQNAGLSARQKLVLQFISAALFLFLRRLVLKDGTTLSFSFGELDLGWLYYPLSIFILLGVVNSANLTDGIDGLASSVAFSIGVSLFYVSAALNVETSIISAAVIGGAIGFLIFNLHPAKIFMGDTGSLFFGSLIASCGFTLKNPVLMLFICGVYVLEGFSVVLQVLSYKITRKRIFKMAPLHHHLEKCGWSENRICIVGILSTFVMSLPAYILYLP